MPQIHNNKATDTTGTESGVAIFYILLAVILFAALGFAFMQTMNSSASNLTREEARVYAQDVLSYANRLSRAVQRVQTRGGCSENDISFYLPTNTFLSAYEHTPEVEDRCKVFHDDGGAITWLTAPEGVNDGSDWVFTGVNRVDGIANNTGITGNELVALLLFVDRNVCIEINKLVGNTNPSGEPPIETNGFRTDLFTGTYNTTTGIETTGNILDGKNTGCMEATSIGGSAEPDTYHFYHVLVAR